MSQKTWIGGATPAVAQIWAGVVGTTTNAQTYILTVTDPYGNTNAITYAVSNPPDTTVTAIAANIITAWNASQSPACMAITASAGTAGQIILTADVAGVPFKIAATGTGTWTGTGITKINVGPNDYECPNNWAGLAIPVGSDNVLITGGSDILYNLDQSGVSVAAFEVAPGCTAKGGGLGRYFKAACTSLKFGGTGVWYLNVGSSSISPLFTASANPGTNQYGVYLLGSALGIVTVTGNASVAIAAFTSETATVTTVATNTTGRCMIGSGVTLTNIQQANCADCQVGCAATAINTDAGNLSTFGTGAITTITNNGATMNLNSSGTITTLNRYGGLTNFLGSKVARTLTTDNDYGDNTIQYDSAVLTITNKTAGSGQLKITSARV